jgi:predicted Zn-dependent peptidase
MEKVIAGVKAHGFTEEALETSKKNYLFGLARGFETAAGLNQCSDYYFFLGDKLQPYSSFDERRKRIHKLSNNDVIEYARRLYNDSVTTKHTQMNA